MSDNTLAVAVPVGYRDWRSVASLGRKLAYPRTGARLGCSTRDRYLWFANIRFADSGLTFITL
jgi:hypothetical protein